MNKASSFLIESHLKVINYFLSSYEDREDLNIKVGFTLTCLYTWLIQIFYCASEGLPFVSLVCAVSCAVYLISMYCLKKKYIRDLAFSRAIILISILNLNICYLSAGAYLNPTIVWFMAIPVVSVTLRGLKEGAVWSLISSTLTIILMELYKLLNWDLKVWSNEQIFNVGQSNMFTGPVLFYLMFGFFYFSRNEFQKKIESQALDLKKIAFEKEKLLNVIFHDLGRNTSLLSGYIEVFGDRDLDVEQRAKIYRYTEEIKSVLLNAKNLDSHSLGESEERINIFQLFQDVQHMFREKLAKKNLELHFKGDKSVEVFINKTHLQTHILGNLVSNAIKFSHEGEDIIFRVEDKKIEVLNHGVRFTNEQKDGTFGEKGSGVGLEIIKDYCEKNNLLFRIKALTDVKTLATIVFR